MSLLHHTRVLLTATLTATVSFTHRGFKVGGGGTIFRMRGPILSEKNWSGGPNILSKLVPPDQILWRTRFFVTDHGTSYPTIMVIRWIDVLAVSWLFVQRYSHSDSSSYGMNATKVPQTDCRQ